MNKTNTSRNGTAVAFCITAVLLIAAQSFGVVTNGLFDTSLDSNPLGWQYNNADGVVWSSESLTSDGTGSAMLQRSGDLASSILWQTFYVEPGSSSLSFQVLAPAPAIGDETNHFYIQLLDSASQPLLGNTGNDYFFHWKSSSAGWIQSETPAGITVNEDSSNIDSRLYSFDIPVASSWIDNNITLQFKLNHDYINSSETVILIDDVALHGTTPQVVPIPGAMGLALAGLAALGVFRKKPV
jgi:hypothetical protein